jgi:hypothetical protein
VRNLTQERTDYHDRGRFTAFASRAWCMHDSGDGPKSQRGVGDSPDEFGAEWQENMKAFEPIDPEIWK